LDQLSSLKLEAFVFYFFFHMKPAAFRARTNSRPNSRSLPLRVIGNVQGNAIGKICTPLSFHKFFDQSLCYEGQ
jgi:hypothetical protein